MLFTETLHNVYFPEKREQRIMAINKKGSRKIIVDNKEFRWRATGNDGDITVIIWPVDNENSRLVGHMGYHHHEQQRPDGSCVSLSQALVTNRIVREVILQHGVRELISHNGQQDIGNIEAYFNMEYAVRSH